MNCQDALHACLDGLVSSARIELIADRLALPPKTSTLRVNTLKASPCEALSHLQNILDETYGKDYFEASLDAVISDMIRIKALKADLGAVQPAGLPVIVSPDCGKAVLRGANVFVVIILVAYHV